LAYISGCRRFPAMRNSTDVDPCMHRRESAVSDGHCPVDARCDVQYDGSFGIPRCDDHGQRTLYKYPAFCDVYVTCQSHGCLCDGGGAGGADAYAMHAEYACALGTW
jgi:hypothetical protein